MAKVSICIEMLFGEHEFNQRPAAAAAAGFDTIEFWGAGNKDVTALRAACDEAGVRVATFAAMGGLPLVEPQPREALEDALRADLAVAEQFGVDVLIVTVGNALEGVSRREQADNIAANLRQVAPLAAEAGVRIAVEPLNTLVDHVGYFLDSTQEARQIVDQVGSPAVGLLYDCYHMQIMEGNLIETIRANVDVIHHVHVADVPGRYEPGSGEINYASVFKALDEAGYEGWCGMEFRPTDSSAPALERAMRACGLS